MIMDIEISGSFCEPSRSDDFSGLSEEVLEAWVLVVAAAKSYISDINRVLDEGLYNSQTHERAGCGEEEVLDGLHPATRLPDSEQQLRGLVSALEAPEVGDALDCINRSELSIQLLENFLGHSFDCMLSKEVTFFWTTLLLLGEVDSADSRMTSNETDSVDETLNPSKICARDSGNPAQADRDVISLHCCLVFGLVRLLWSIVFVLYGAASLVGVPVQERSTFVHDYLSQRDDDFPRSMVSGPLHRVICGFMTKVRLLITESIPPGFYAVLDRYILGIILCLSEKTLRSGESSAQSEEAPVVVREALLRALIGRSYGDAYERVETCKFRLERMQYLYEHKLSKALSLNGSFPLSLELGAFESLVGFLITSNSGELQRVGLASPSSGTDKDRARSKTDDREHWGRRIREILGVISRGPMMEDLSKDASVPSLEALSRTHVASLDELIWLVFCSDQDGAEQKTSECDQISLTTRLGDLAILMRLVGLEFFWKQRVVSMFRVQAANVVSFLESRKAEESSLRIYSKFVHEFMGSILMGLLDGGFMYIKAPSPEPQGPENSLEDNTEMRDLQTTTCKARVEEYEPVNCDLTIRMILEEFYMEYNWSLKRRVVDLITKFPSSKSAVLDLYITMNYLPNSDILRDVWYSEISREILNYVDGRLLHLHVETSIIVGFYVKSILFLLLLDFPNDWMDKTLTGFGDALRLRGDTTQCIVGWMPLILENCSPVMADSEIVMPISCSDEGVYPQFSIYNPNYRNECRGIFEKPFEQVCDYSQDFQSPQMKLVLDWISHIYGSNLTLLSDYIFNLASRVIGSWQDIGFESNSLDGTKRCGLVDETTWMIDEKRFQKDESVYEMIKMTIGGRNGDNLLKGGGSADSKLGTKDEQQLLTNCSIILQDISSSILDNKGYSSFMEELRMDEDSRPVVTGFTISRNYWSESVINMEIREDSFPLASVLEGEIGEYRQFFEREHPGRTFNCYSGYGVGMVDLTALDGTVKSNVTLNFLQISIYDYISSKCPERGLPSQEDGASKDGFLDSDKLLSSNSILNWFSISPKASEKPSDPMEKASEERDGETRVTFADLLGHFGLDEQTVRWSVENMLSRGIVQIVDKEDGSECFELPSSFSNTRISSRGVAEEQEQEQRQRVAAAVPEKSSDEPKDGGSGSGVNDMTVMLDFNGILNSRAGVASLGGLPRRKAGSSFKRSLTLSSLVETSMDDSSEQLEEPSGEKAEDEEDEDLNLNFPTGIITTTISLKSKDFPQDARHNGPMASLDGPSGPSSKSGEAKPGASTSGGSLPPMISFSETYFEKYCYFTTPVVLDEESHGPDLALENSRASKEGDHAKYDIVRECELLIRATLQLSGAMAPAVLFGRVRTAIASQSEGKSSSDLDHGDKQSSGASQSPDAQYTLTWPQHVQAINNMVDRGEVYNKGGRLFLKK